MFIEVYPDKEPEILEYVESFGFKVFRHGDYNLNIIGVRNLSERVAGLFDDQMYIVFKKGGVWQQWTAKITTDPGRYYLEKKDYRQDGVAIMVHPQQCRGAYKIGPHGRTRYTALRQHKPVKVWRDNNHDSILDFDSYTEIHEGIFYINIHRASTNPNGTKYVSKWSAGCQVFENIHDFELFMDLCYKSETTYGDTFTYTLVAR
jgi:hypothetical protein